MASVMHESNSFNPVLTPLEDFQIHDRSLALWGSSNTELAGFIEAASASGLECTPGFYATATPGGVVEERAFETLVDRLLQGIAAAGSVEGVFLALHGAMVAEH
ncbi:MAG: M81 family metallopeptidase, partial [Bryobacteraceae bacterium]